MGAHRVNVNAICPGFVETDMIEVLHEHAGIPGVQHKKVMEMVLGRVPLKRLPQPREVADLKMQGSYGALAAAVGKTGTTRGKGARFR